MILGFTGTCQGMTPQQLAALPSVIATLPERVFHGGAVGADEEFHRWLGKVIVRPSAESISDMPQDRRDPQYYSSSLFVSRSRVEVRIYAVGGTRFDFWSGIGSAGWHWMFSRVNIMGPFSDPLERNRTIARECDHLLACPAEPTEQLRSGTWSTVRYARTAGKPMTIILPDGAVVSE